jgi:hypothetical protein
MEENVLHSHFSLSPSQSVCIYIDIDIDMCVEQLHIPTFTHKLKEYTPTI